MINNKFKSLLNQISFNPDFYLELAKMLAKYYGYDEDKLTFSNKDKFKLNYDGVHFGSSENNDFLIYGWLYKHGCITREQMLKHRERYLKRATKIKGQWKTNDKSKNNLAIKILWAG